jgi:Flp pilus assembly protein TadG
MVMTRARERRGTAAVELVIALPVLMMLVLGIVDVGRVLTTSSALHRAVASGARRASDASVADTAITSIVNAAASPIVPTSVTVTRAADSVVVTAASSVQSMTPLWHLLWASGTITVNSTAAARVTP